MTDTIPMTPQRKARYDAGLSIRELERLSGVNRGLLSLWERGRYLPTADEQRRIYAALEDNGPKAA